jgi:hypothetical protein
VEFNPKERMDDLARDLFGGDHVRRNVSFGAVCKLVFDELSDHSRVMLVMGVFHMKRRRVQDSITRLA